MKSYVIKEEGGKKLFAPVKLLDKPSGVKIIDNPARIEIIKLLEKQQLYPAEIAKKLKMHEQIVYYHVKQLLNAEVLSVVEKKEIRGTIAKKLASKNMNFTVCMSEEWKDAEGFFSTEIDKKLEIFFDTTIKDGKLDGKFVVGSPDPHGPLKARARDGHFAVELSLFLGGVAKMPDKFAVELDVDINLQLENSNLIVIGGPATNLIMSSLNDSLPIKFRESKTWELFSEKTQKRYVEEAFGLIAKVPNPHFPRRNIIILAGISRSGTKAAVIALTRHYKSVLSSYNGQAKWGIVVQGYDMDGDGQIDSAEIVE